MGHEDMEHVAVPAGPGAVLVMPHAEKGFALEQGTLDRPAKDGDLNHRLEGAVFGSIAEDVFCRSLLVLGFGAEEEEPDVTDRPNQATHDRVNGASGRCVFSS